MRFGFSRSRLLEDTFVVSPDLIGKAYLLQLGIAELYYSAMPH